MLRHSHSRFLSRATRFGTLVCVASLVPFVSPAGAAPDANAQEQSKSAASSASARPSIGGRASTLDEENALRAVAYALPNSDTPGLFTTDSGRRTVRVFADRSEQAASSALSRHGSTTAKSQFTAGSLRGLSARLEKGRSCCSRGSCERRTQPRSPGAAGIRRSQGPFRTCALTPLRSFASQRRQGRRCTARCQVAGAVARPGSHRTVLALFAHGSSGRRVANPAVGRLSTSIYPCSRAMIGWAGAVMGGRLLRCSVASDVRPRAAKYALRRP